MVSVAKNRATGASSRSTSLLRQELGIEMGDVDGGERAEIRPALAHPGDELLVAAPARGAAVQHEVDVAVDARPERPEARAADRAAGDVRAAPRRHGVVEIDERRRMRKRRKHGRLRRHVDVLPAARARTMHQRDERTRRGLGAGPGARLRNADAHRLAVRFPRERHRTPGGHDLDVRCPPSRVRPGTPERRDRHVHQTRKARVQQLADRTASRDRPAMPSRSARRHPRAGDRGRRARQARAHRGARGAC